MSLLCNYAPPSCDKHIMQSYNAVIQCSQSESAMNDAVYFVERKSVASRSLRQLSLFIKTFVSRLHDEYPVAMFAYLTMTT